MSAQLPWYVARAAGLMAWALVTASVVWGLAISTKMKVGGRRPRPNWMLDLHRYLGGLATIFTGVHIVAVVMDSYVHFGLVSVLVPLKATWHPVAVAWGIAGLYLLLAVELTSLARSRLPRRLWRLTHFASFPLFVVATVHGLSAGTDAKSWLFPLTAALSALAVYLLAAVRIGQATDDSKAPARGRSPGPAAAARRSPRPAAAAPAARAAQTRHPVGAAAP